MSNRLPSIGVATTVTSPLSQGYIAYLACIATWSKWADQVVIIDGGTTDDSYKVLKNWSSSTNYEAYYLPETYWDLHGCWHEAQWGINEMVGLNLLKTDWAFVIPGDHIIDISTVKGVREELSRNEP